MMGCAGQAGTGRKRKQKGPSDQGLTLIELVVAMAIFALVAVLGLQALSGSMRLREDLSGRAERAISLSRAASLIRADLSALAPMLFYPPGQGAAQSAVRVWTASGPDGGPGVAFSVIGQPRLSTTGAAAPVHPNQPQTFGPLGLGRVEWTLDTASATLRRQSWPALYPLAADQAGPQVPVLTGISQISLRTYWESTGWVQGARPQADIAPVRDGPALDGDASGGAPEVYSDALPLAIELTLVSRDHGRLVFVEAVP